MPAVNRPIYIEQGATFTFGFNWHRADDTGGTVVPGDPYDLTGWSARMQIRKTQQAPALVDATDINGKIILGGATGRIDVNLSAADTNLLTTKAAQYDLEVEDPTGVVYRLLEGQVTVSPNITQLPEDPPVGA